jgi:hypothetical protein
MTKRAAKRVASHAAVSSHVAAAHDITVKVFSLPHPSLAGSDPVISIAIDSIFKRFISNDSIDSVITRDLCCRITLKEGPVFEFTPVLGISPAEVESH